MTIPKTTPFDIERTPWALLTAVRVRVDEIVAYRALVEMPHYTLVWLRGASSPLVIEADWVTHLDDYFAPEPLIPQRTIDRAEVARKAYEEMTRQMDEG